MSSVVIQDVDVRLEGEGADTIVMVHGWPDTYRLWDAQVAALKDRFRCVRFTLPGFDAAKPHRPWTLDELIDFLKEVVERVSPGRAVILMLHDWGCVFGYQFYVRHPQLVKKIVGVDIGDPGSLRGAMTGREKFIAVAYQAWLALAWKIGGDIGDRMTRYMARRARCPSDPAPMSWRMGYPYYVLWFGGRGAFRGKVRRFMPACPMLYVYGRHKPLRFHAPAWAEELGRRPGNQVTEFDTGHWVMSEQPERFNQVVCAWLARA
jgi:pimeloyl-ACP methyl ester carboxylesterase